MARDETTARTVPGSLMACLPGSRAAGLPQQYSPNGGAMRGGSVQCGQDLGYVVAVHVHPGPPLVRPSPRTLLTSGDAVVLAPPVKRKRANRSSTPCRQRRHDRQPHARFRVPSVVSRVNVPWRVRL